MKSEQPEVSTLSRRPATTIQLHDDDTLIVTSRGTTVKIEQGSVKISSDSSTSVSVLEHVIVKPIGQLHGQHNSTASVVRRDITRPEPAPLAHAQFSQPQYQKKQGQDLTKRNDPQSYEFESDSTHGEDESPSS